MPLTDLLLAQLADPFRIGLILALLYTAQRNRAVTGRIVPLAAGVVFVAVLIPTTMQTAGPDPLATRIAMGLVANVVIVAVSVGLWAVIRWIRS